MKKNFFINAFFSTAVSLSAFTTQIASADTLIASPGYIAPGCNWSTIHAGYPFIEGIYCSGQFIVQKVEGTGWCGFNGVAASNYYFTFPIYCNNYKLYRKD